jgi:hypothetical protein
LLQFGAFIDLCVKNPTQLSLHQLDFVALDIQVGMVKGQHWQIARFDFKGCDFHALPYFIFLP